MALGQLVEKPFGKEVRGTVLIGGRGGYYGAGAVGDNGAAQEGRRHPRASLLSGDDDVGLGPLRIAVAERSLTEVVDGAEQRAAVFGQELGRDTRAPAR